MQFFPILQGLERICLNICDYLSFYNITILSNLLKTRKKSPTPPLSSNYITLHFSPLVARLCRLPEQEGGVRRGLFRNKRPYGSSDELSIINYQLSITKCRRPRPWPRPCRGGELGDVLYLLLSSFIFFYLLLLSSPSTFFYLLSKIFCGFCLLVILFFSTFGGQIKYMFY